MGFVVEYAPISYLDEVLWCPACQTQVVFDRDSWRDLDSCLDWLGRQHTEACPRRPEGASAELGAR